MIAVTFALPAESSDFARLVGNRGDVRVVHTGVGARIAEERIEHFLANETPKLLISAGFAGAVTARLRVADILIDERLSDPTLLQRVRALPDFRFGKLTSAADVIDSKAKRAELAAAIGADAVDMET